MNIPQNLYNLKPENKPGRTIIILHKNISPALLSNSRNISVSKSGTLFVEKETIQQSMELYHLLKSNHIYCKYAYYRCFFTMRKGQINMDSITYNDIKENMMLSLFKKFSDINILHLTIFTKNRKLTKHGYIVLDRIHDFQNVITQKTYSFLLDTEAYIFDVFKFINKMPNKNKSL